MPVSKIDLRDSSIQDYITIFNYLIFFERSPGWIHIVIKFYFYQPTIPDAIFNKSFTTRWVIMCAATYYEIKKDGISMFL